MSSSCTEVVEALFAAAGGATQDVDAMVALMSEDAVLEACVPSHRSVGRDAIRKELRIQNNAATDLSFEIRNVVGAESVVVVERVDIFTMGGKKMRLHITGVFEFNEERQITAWRDYWDLNDLAQQLGIDVAAIRG